MFPERTSLRPASKLHAKRWAAVFATSALSLGLLSQAALSEQTMSFGVSQTLRSTDNTRLAPTSAGTTVASDTTLSFGLQNTTAISALSLDLSGVFRVVDDPVSGSDSRFRDPSLDLTYSRAGVNSRLDLTAGYDRPDLAFNLPDVGSDSTVQDIFTGAGERENIDLGLRFETGLDAPFGVVVDLDHQERNFTDTTDPLLFDNQTQSASISTIYRLSRATEIDLTLSESRYEAEDTNGTNRTTQRATVGFKHDFSETDRLRFSIGQSEVEETFDALPGTTNITDGVVSEIEYQRDLPNGAVAVNLDSNLNSQGRSTTLEFGRQLTLPTGDLDVTVGFVTNDGSDAEPVGRIAYRQNFVRSSFDVELSRSASVSETLNQVTETTTLTMGYDMELSPLSSLSLDVSYSDVEVSGATTGRARSRITAEYRRSLTEDWDMNLGVEHQRFDPDAGSSANSQSVYFTLERSFEGFR